MGQPAARMTDLHVCPMQTPGTPPIPHVGGPILPPGMPTVLIGNLAAARVGDMCICVGPPDVIINGAITVLIGNMPAARMGSSTAHGGTVTIGMPTVLLGEGLSAIAAIVSPEVMALIIQSPTMVALLTNLTNEGWTVEQGPAGDGTFAESSTKRIVVDAGEINDPNECLISLSHEAGHAAYNQEELDPYVPMDGLSREEYINQNTNKDLRNEGEATLTNITVRDEIRHSSGGETDIGVAGASNNMQAYQEAYDQYQQDGDRDAARTRIGDVYAHGEHPSGQDASVDYYDYYSQPFREEYDAAHPHP